MRRDRVATGAGVIGAGRVHVPRGLRRGPGAPAAAAAPAPGARHAALRRARHPARAGHAAAADAPGAGQHRREAGLRRGAGRLQQRAAPAHHPHVRVAVGHHQPPGAVGRAAPQGLAHAPHVGRHHRAAARDGAVHRPVRGGGVAGAAGRGRVHPGAEAGAGLPPAAGRGHARSPAGGDPAAAHAAAPAVAAAAAH